MTTTQKFAVIGLGRFGSRLATVLAESGAEVIAVDRDAALVEAHRDCVTLAVRLDGTNEEALKAQSIDRVDAAIVGIGHDFESAVLTVATLKSLGVPRIFCRAETDVQARILTRVGAEAIVNPEREAALRWAHRLMLPNLERYVELGKDHSLVYVSAPSTFHHKTLEQIGLRRRYGVNVVAIKRSQPPESARPQAPGGPAIITVPAADTTIEPGDVLILIGRNERLDDLPAD